MSGLRQRLRQSAPWQRWQLLAVRDRQALLALAGFLLLAALYLGAWQPARQALEQARAHLQAQRELAGYLQRHRTQATAGHAAAPLEAARLREVVEVAARDHGLRLADLADHGAEGLQVQLLDSPAAPLLDWLLALERAGARLGPLTLERTAPGRVDARLVLRADEP